MHRIPCFLVLVALCFTSSALAWTVEWGVSWDGTSLQDVLDQHYGPGVIDAATDYEGYSPGDADIPYWVDDGIEGLLVREIGSNSHLNTFGWYKEDFVLEIIDGNDDGLIFGAQAQNNASVIIDLPPGVSRFGFFLNPRGPQNGTPNAPHPEKFYTNRYQNDIGPDGSGPVRGGPTDGDPQVLIYNISHVTGTATFVLAWEDLDYGSPLSALPQDFFTDSDFQDLVVEITALSPVPTEVSSWSRMKALYRD